MFDTIHLWLPKEESRSFDVALLANVEAKEKNDMQTITGNYKNLRIFYKETGIFIAGSLCKYLLGDNMQTLGRGSTKEAICRLSDELYLPFQQANVTRVDVAENLIMQYEVPYYYSFLGDARHYKRLEQENGIYYRQTKREMLFYGKLLEQEYRGVPIPPLLQGRNVLRYEYRFKNRLCRQLNMPQVKASYLSDEKTYMAILQIWRDEYYKIRKVKSPLPFVLTLNNMKQLQNELMLLGIKTIGGEQAMQQIIEQCKQQGKFQNKMQVKRVKDRVKKVCNMPLITGDSDAILELNRKVDEAIKI